MLPSVNKQISSWSKSFFPFLIALSFSRLMLQIDLVFLGGFPNYIMITSFLSQVSIFDVILALSTVPVCLVIISKYKSPRIRSSIITISIVLGVIASLISILITYLLIFKFRLLTTLHIEYSSIIIILIFTSITIPFKWLQLSSSSLLHQNRKGTLVVKISAMSLILNIITNFIFIRLFGPIGCWISTLVITMSSSIYLAKKSNPNIIRNIHISLIVIQKSRSKILMEIIRVTFEKAGMAIIVGVLFYKVKSTVILLQFGILFEIRNLLLIFAVATYRTTLIFSDSTYDGSTKYYKSFNIIFNFILGTLIFIFANTITDFYSLNDSSLLNEYLRLVGIYIMIDGTVAFLRATIQIAGNYKQSAIVESIIMFIFLIPFVFISISFEKYSNITFGLIINEILVALLYLHILYFNKKGLRILK